MNSNIVVINQKYGHKTKLYQYLSDSETKFSILIFHGMAEHHSRYLNFVSYLNSQGIDVYLYDHRGHGTDKAIEDLGFFSSENGYKKVIDDAINIAHFVDQNKRTNKLILMGHSMGSLILRNVIQKFDKFDGAIIAGTTYPPQFKLKLGILLSSLIKKIHGAKHISPFFDQIIFGGSNYRKLSTKTKNDWLTRNDAIVSSYTEDPYCGFICSISFYQDLLILTSLASTVSKMKRTSKNLPIFIISGDMDPVGNLGKEVLNLYKSYQKWGYNKVSLKLYPDCRHELLQELNVDEIMEDITMWIKSL